jgi:hypothetical protein
VGFYYLNKRRGELKTMKIIICLVLILFFYLIHPGFTVIEVCKAQDTVQPYILTEIVQIVASEPASEKFKVLRALINDYPEIKGADRIVLYLNALTSIDIIVKTRANLFRNQRRNYNQLKQNYELAFSWFCFPFGPPHEKKEDLIKTRLKVIENMYTNLTKRDQFVKSLNLKYLRYPNDTLINMRLNLFDILDTKIFNQCKR